MPRSQKQFAAVELPPETDTATIRVFESGGALLDETVIQVETSG